MPASASRAGRRAPALFADRIFTLLLASQIVLLAVALIFTPTVIDVLAPGFAHDPGRYALAVELTRITFPYLLLITLVTLYGGILNALQRFAAAAAAPILLNLSIIVALLLAAFFPTAGHAAAWGVLISGVLQALLVGGDCLARRRADAAALAAARCRRAAFFRALGPATVGSAGVQLALFADTIIASFLPAGALSALYYADRLNQLADRRHRHRRRHGRSCRKWRGGSRPATTRALLMRRTAPSNSRCCCRSPVLPPSSPFPSC